MPEYTARFELIDDFNRRGSKSFKTLPSVADYATAAAAAAAFQVDLAVLTGMRILAYTLSERIVVVDAATTDASRDEGLTMTLRKPDNANDDMKIPAPILSIFDANGQVITDPALPAAVSDFLANFEDGSGVWTFSDGEQYTEFVKGVLDE